MANITLSVPEDLKRKMEQFPEINWSEVARQAIKERATQLAVLRDIASKSKLTEKDALELGRKINRGLAKRYRELM
ncbi:MAG: hypothetical protein HYT70_00295 [Candidatus Aenigmarchaeota archaeon]|nr:hypothetical protein [Candidatus Aenigmarchaeota archaeon]